MSVPSGDASGISVEMIPHGRNGSNRYQVTARLDDRALHADTFDISMAARRETFLRRVAERAISAGTPFNQQAAEQILLEQLHASERPGCDEGMTPQPQADDHEAILQTVGIEVLGEQDDQSIQCWVPTTQKRWLIKSLPRWSSLEMLQAMGDRGLERLWLGKEDDQPANTFTPAQVKQAVALVAARRPRIGWGDLVGQGMWNHDGGILIVNGATAAVYDGQRFHRVQHPVLRRKIVDFNSAKRWIGRLAERVRGMHRQAAGDLLARLRTWLSQWNWTHTADADVAAALVFATFIQACWTWRPLVTITGESDAGKSTLFEDLILPIFGGWTIAADRSTEAGIRQAIGHDACPVVIDEFDKYKHRAAVLELFRTSSRGGSVLRGTRDQEGRAYGVRHIAWFAAIESGEMWGQDRNRRIRLELNKPTNRGVLDLPPPADLAEFGQQVAAAALWAAMPAIAIADRIKRTRIAGVHGRLVECFSVPAAMYAVLTAGLDATDDTAVGSLTTMISNRTSLQSQGEPDQAQLLRDIFASNIRASISQGDSTVYQERAVGQLLQTYSGDETIRNSRALLEAKGIKIVSGRLEPERRLFVVHEVVQRELLAGTRWAEIQIDQLLVRLPGARREQQRCGGMQRPWGVSLPWPGCLECLDSQGNQQDNSSPSAALS